MLRSTIILAWAVLVATSCDDTAAPVGTTPEFLAINGARHPAVSAGATFVCVGTGFGTDPETGAVLVTTEQGLAPAEILEWDDTAIRAQLPPSATSGPVRVVVRGDTLEPLDLFVRPDTAYDPATRVWTAGAALPRPIAGAAGAALRYPRPEDGRMTSIVVLNGGVGADSAVLDSTYLGFVDASGAITSWTPAPDTIVPAPRHLHAMTAVDQTTATLDLEAVAYMMGGVDTAGRVLSDVFGIGVTSTGEYGFWTRLTPLPGARAGAAAVAAFGNLIVIGGFGSDSLALPSVHAAIVNANGTINGWFDGPPLPEGRAFAAAVVRDDILYVVGGETGVVDPAASDTSLVAVRPEVYAIHLSRRTGFFADSAWMVLTPLATARSRHAAFVLGDAMVVVAGIYPGRPSPAESEFAPILPDGTLGAFAATGQVTIADQGGDVLSGFSAPLVWDEQGRAVATLIGGRDSTGTVLGSVWWN